MIALQTVMGTAVLTGVHELAGTELRLHCWSHLMQCWQSEAA